MLDYSKPLKKEILILGEKYILILEDEKENERYVNCDGYNDSSVKEIHVAITQPSVDDKKDITQYRKSVIRHEIVHAFLHESGLDTCSNDCYCGWAKNEEMVYWFAIQSPKIYKVFNELELL